MNPAPPVIRHLIILSLATLFLAVAETVKGLHFRLPTE
jgi:hypothetical protein